MPCHLQKERRRQGTRPLSPWEMGHIFGALPSPSSAVAAKRHHVARALPGTEINVQTLEGLLCQADPLPSPPPASPVHKYGINGSTQVLTLWP